MPKVTRPRIRAPEREEEESYAPQAAAASGGDWRRLRERASVYAFGTLVCGAGMLALAAWMGGSLGAFGRSLNNGFNVLMNTAGLSVERVVVVGLDPAVEEKVREAAGVEAGDHMFAADPYAIRERLSTLDAVAGVSVHRLWPDQVTIIAETREPLALWRDGSHWRVIDQRGRTFAEANPEDFMHLPKVVGPSGDEAAPGLLAHLSEYPDLESRLEAAHRVGGRRWDVTFEGGVVVALPEDAALELALASLNLLEARNRVLQLPLTRIDARHPDRFALRPAPGGPQAEGA
jgi:cell division protein FtsQ